MGNQFPKECKDCHQQIILVKVGDAWKAQNPDYTPHVCPARQPASKTTPGGSEPDFVSRITEYTPANVVFGERQLFIVPEKRSIIKTEYPVGTVVRVWKEKGTLTNIEKASSAEIEKFLQQEAKLPAAPAPQQPITEPAPEKETPCTSPSTPAPVAPATAAPQRKIPDTDTLLSMCSSSDGYWRAKFYLDLRRCEEIRQQTERKSWQDAISLAITHHDGVGDMDMVILKTAEKIHAFVSGKVKAVQ